MNKAINEVRKNMDYDVNAKELDLKDKLKDMDLKFLPKMIKQFSFLETLDLSNSDLHSKTSVEKVC
jgi:hypothetical protein